MSEITYITVTPDWIHVLLDGKKVGRILPVEKGYAYFPNGSKTHGEVFPTIDQVKQTLTEE